MGISTMRHQAPRSKELFLQRLPQYRNADQAGICSFQTTQHLHHAKVDVFMHDAILPLHPWFRGAYEEPEMPRSTGRHVPEVLGINYSLSVGIFQIRLHA